MLHLLGESSAMLLHELRSPLQAISAQLQVTRRLLHRELGDRHDARFSLIFDELRRMDGMLEQFLQLASRRPPQWGPVELRRLCLESSQLLRSLCLSQGVELTLAEGPDLPAISGDQGPLRQVLTNLVVNGVQACRAAGRPGQVRITLEEEQGPLGYFQLVRVWDNGCGLPPGDRERLFRPYFTTKAKGSGLGLAISRRIAEARGGELLCEDRTDGPGAVFTLRLPGEGKSVMNNE
jgi:signal transduction histidine kinase